LIAEHGQAFIHAKTKYITLCLNLNQTGIRRVKFSGQQLHDRTVLRIGLGNVLAIERHLGNFWRLIQMTATEDAA
jgi:hypothetical protein